VHNTDDGTVIFDESVVKGRVFDGVWLDDNRRLAIGGEDAVLTILDPGTGRRRSTPRLDPWPPRELTDPDHPVEIAGLAYVPTHGAIAVVMKPSGLRVFDVATLSPTNFPVPQSAEYGPVCSVPLGSGYLAIRSGEQSVVVRALEDGRTINQIADTGGMPRAIRFSPAAGALAVAFREGTVETWDAEALVAGSNRRVRRFCAHDGRAVSIDISPDGHHVASGGEDGLIRLWHRRSLRHPFDVPLTDRLWHTVFSPCGRWLALVTGPAGRPGRVTMFDARTGARLWSSADEPVSSGGDLFLAKLPGEVAFDPTGSELLILHSDFSVRGRDARTGRVMNVYRAAADEPVNRTQVSPDGRSVVVRSTGIVAVVGRDSGATVVHRVLPTREYLGIVRTTRGDLWIQQDSPQAKVLLSADLQSRPQATLVGPSEKLQCAAVSRDGRYLAAGGVEGIIYIWDLSTGDPPTKCIGHDDGFGLLMFAPDGGTLISHSNDYSVRFWHVATGAELLKIGSRGEPIVCMGLSPAGNLLVLGVEHNGRYGLQIHRLGPNRDSLPRTFEFPPIEAP
jgi:WD40 repeat protein